MKYLAYFYVRKLRKTSNFAHEMAPITWYLGDNCIELWISR